jgi:flagellar capping protein FliD
MSMSVGGLVSGLDTNTIVSQLIQAEGAPQAALKTRLSIAQAGAVAYRSINTRFDAIRTAAEAVLKPETWTAAKASSTATSVSASATPGAAPGSLTFDVTATAAAHSVVSGANWTATTDAYGMTSPIEVRDAAGVVKGSITIGGTGTLGDAVTAINDSSFGLSATAVQVAPGSYRLQVTSKTSGAADSFDIGTAGTFAVSTQGTDAKLTVGTGAGAYSVTSATNTFTGLMDGVTITVTKPETAVTVSVAKDPNAVATKVQALVDAANSALSGIKNHTNPKGGASAVLKGDSALRGLAGGVIAAASYGVGTDGSMAAAGLQLNRDGTIAFDKAKFLTALADDPALVERLFVGTATAPGAAQRLHDVAKTATDTTTGTLTLLAKGRDSLAENIQDKIEAWDVRLVNRKATLTRQFTAMETALSGLQNQSSWLAGQINSLPSWS